MPNYEIESFPVKLTAKTTTAGGTILYSWTEQVVSGTDGLYTDLVSGRKGVNNAREKNNADLTLPYYVTLDYEGAIGGAFYYTFSPGVTGGGGGAGGIWAQLTNYTPGAGYDWRQASPSTFGFTLTVGGLSGSAATNTAAFSSNGSTVPLCQSGWSNLPIVWITPALSGRQVFEWNPLLIANNTGAIITQAAFQALQLDTQGILSATVLMSGGVPTGFVQLALAAATSTQWGVVTTVQQVFAGNKSTVGYWRATNPNTDTVTGFPGQYLQISYGDGQNGAGTPMNLYHWPTVMGGCTSPLEEFATIFLMNTRPTTSDAFSTGHGSGATIYDNSVYINTNLYIFGRVYTFDGSASGVWNQLGTGGSGGMAIGAPVTGGTAGDFLKVDVSGNLGQQAPGLTGTL